MRSVKINDSVAERNHISTKPGFFRSLVPTIPMWLLSGLFLFGAILHNGTLGLSSPFPEIAMLVTYLFLMTLFCLAIKTGEIYKYRLIIFIIIAVGSIFTLNTNLIDARGSLIISKDDIANCQTPFCHIALPMLILPAILTKTIIFAGSLLTGFAVYGFAAIVCMTVLWLGATIAIGRGWCSWGCYFGGLDEGFSCLKKRRSLKIAPKWTYLRYAVLLAAILLSAVTLTPSYCIWLCPVRVTSDYAKIDSLASLIQTIIIISGFISLVVVLPILTKRRTLCSLFCPMGAFQTLLNKFNIFQVRVDQERCVNCKLCVQNCPSLAINEESLKKGETLLSCSKCGKCIDICPRKAIFYHIKGTPPKSDSKAARLVFLNASFFILIAIGGNIIFISLLRLIKLFTTGSMI